jgi:hypothetical protein
MAMEPTVTVDGRALGVGGGDEAEPRPGSASFEEFVAGFTGELGRDAAAVEHQGHRAGRGPTVAVKLACGSRKAMPA